MEYQLLANQSTRELSKAFNKLLSEGWKLYRGVSISTSGNITIYAQALIKEAK